MSSASPSRKSKVGRSAGCPADLLEGMVVQRATEVNDVIEQEFHCVFARIVVACTVGFRANVGFNPEFLTQFAAQAILIRLPRFHLATGKLPFQRKSTIAPALTNEQLAPCWIRPATTVIVERHATYLVSFWENVARARHHKQESGEKAKAAPGGGRVVARWLASADNVAWQQDLDHGVGHFGCLCTRQRAPQPQKTAACAQGHG